MSLQDKMKQLRKKQGLTLLDIANNVGVTEATVQRWESGNIKNLRQERIAKLAEILKCSPAYLMGWEDTPPKKFPSNCVPVPKMQQIPLLGAISCGEPILATENLDGMISCPQGIKADIALTCNGDSMINARIFDGDVVLIKQQPTIEDGDIAAVLIDNEATLKRVKFYPGKIVLHPENPLYDDIILSDNDTEQITIIGKAVYFISAIR